MFKSVGKFIWRIAKCVIGATVICFVGYYLSKGLNWLTGITMKFLENAAAYFMSNWIAVIVVIIALIIGGLAFEGVVNAFRRRRSNREAQE